MVLGSAGREQLLKLLKKPGISDWVEVFYNREEVRPEGLTSSLNINE